MAWNEEPKTYEEAIGRLRDRQKKFVELYLEQPVASKARDGAGYSKTTEPRSILRIPAVAKALSLGFAEVMSSAEVKARIAGIACGTIEDFIDIREVSEVVKKSYEVMEAVDLITSEIISLEERGKSAAGEDLRFIRRELRRLDRVLRRCYRLKDEIDDGKREATEEVDLEIEREYEVKAFIDLKKARELGRLHLVKKLKHTKYGLEVELHDSSWALELLGRHYRLFDESGMDGDGEIKITNYIVDGGDLPNEGA